MTLFYPDLNIWLALSVGNHRHYEDAWNWLRDLPQEIRLIFSRYTHLGLLRLLTNRSVMGEKIVTLKTAWSITLKTAWSIYDGWLHDPRVEFHPEPRGVDSLLRELTEPFASKSASNLIGDCYLLACAKASQSALVTFDRALYDLARQKGYAAVMPDTIV